MSRHATTVLVVRRDGVTAMGGDGQVSLDDTVVKARAVKLRTMAEGRVLTGFAGGVADALTLFERFEEELQRSPKALKRAAVELAKQWRQDEALRQLQALLLVANKDTILMVSGSGDVIEPDENVTAIGSGGNYALAAARALLDNTELGAEEIVEQAMKISAQLCVYTNHEISVEVIEN